MDDEWHFPDGRSFSEIAGLGNINDADLFDDSASALESWQQIDEYGEDPDAASVRDSDISETLKRSLDCDEPDLTYKRPVVNRFTPRIVGETSGAVFDAVASSSKPQLPLQAWEHGVFGYICGNNDIVPMPTFPKLEQPADFAPPPQPNVVDSSVVAIDKDPVFTFAVKMRARWTCNSDLDAREHVLMRWRAALYHNLDGSEVGQMLRDNRPETHLEILSEVFEGKSTNTLSKRVNSLLHYLNHWRLADEVTEDFIPFTSGLVYGYLKHLKNNNRLSAAKDFLQCVKFCEHVVGLKSTDSLTRPWISGIAKAAYSHTKPKKESRPLTVKEIIQLESFLIKGNGHHLDRYACGVFLCMLYGRARSSDFRNIDKMILDFCNGDDRTGYIEIHTVDYKCARLSRVTGRPYIVLIPVYGLCGESWGKAFVSAASTNGVGLSVVSGPLLLCPDASGQLTSRYPSANEVTAWVNGLLDRLVPDRQPGFTSQGLKATMLSWASKAGVGEYDRHILGGHSMKGRQTAATYARDTLTSPIKKLEEVIASVRHGSFLPDSSRSNMFPSATGKTDARGSDGLAPQNIVVPTGSETGGSASQAADATAETQEKAGDDPVIIDDSSSSSDTESSPESAPGDEVAEKCMSKSPHHDQLQCFHWKDGCIVYKNDKTRKLHLQSLGSETGAFLCGRSITEDYKEFKGTIACDGWKCKQCDSCRPLHDVGSMIAHIDRWEAKRASDRHQR